MTAAPVTAPPTGSPEPESRLPFGGLVGSELRRLRLRRLVLILLALYTLALGAILVIAFFEYHSNDPAAVQALYDRDIGRCEGTVGAAELGDTSDFTGERFDCRGEFGSPAEYAADRGKLYVLARALPVGITATAATFAVLAFLLGATSIGADWSARTLPGTLTWEPRRIRLLCGRLLALLLAVGAAAVVVQGIHIGGAMLIAWQRGTFAGVTAHPDFWQQVLAKAGRGVLLAGMFAAAGFAVSAFLRNTAAALGVAFAYLTLGEILLRGVRQQSEPWLVSRNVEGWMSQGGTDVTYLAAPGEPFDPEGFREVVIHLSNARSGAYLLAGCAALLLLGAVTFKRRDIT